MKLWKFYLRRWWHCVTHFHRGVTTWRYADVIRIGCECGWNACYSPPDGYEYYCKRLVDLGLDEKKKP